MDSTYIVLSLFVYRTIKVPISKLTDQKRRTKTNPTMTSLVTILKTMMTVMILIHSAVDQRMTILGLKGQRKRSRKTRKKARKMGLQKRKKIHSKQNTLICFSNKSQKLKTKNHRCQIYQVSQFCFMT